MLEVTLAPEKAEIMVSEPTYLRVQVRTRSQAALTLQASWMGRNSLGRPENYDIEAIDNNGKVVPVPAPGPQFGGKSWDVVLSHDKDFETRLFLPSWAPFTEPGTYELRFTSTLPVRSSEHAEWTQVSVRASVTLQVIADDHVRLGELIEHVATRAKARNSDHEDLRVLTTIQDERVLPHLAALLRSDQYSKRFSAAVALGTWNDQRALDALERASTTRAADFALDGYTTEELRAQSAAQLRLTVAQALSESPHPDALPLLLRMKSDDYEGVRLTVVHKISKLPPARSKAMLRAFAKDRDPTVAGEAKRYLSEI